MVGVAGEMEHGGACIHPRLGRPMRAALGGGAAVHPVLRKGRAAGTPLYLPLGHKDDPWSFAHFDTITVFLADALRHRSRSSSPTRRGQTGFPSRWPRPTAATPLRHGAGSVVASRLNAAPCWRRFRAFVRLLLVGLLG
ncbi:amino acid synthesis family protein [Falsiroseomonas sp. E2-1-a4]|uniref:amino acid synthesis family protein n=1 Tax=Falsiroseomonas sp. E2-1-a4 TaxID=3239299 RepID=UPI003F3AF7F5